MDESRDSWTTSERSPVDGRGRSKRHTAADRSSSPPVVVVTTDSSSCGEVPSFNRTEFSRASVERFSLRGALRRGVEGIIGRRTPVGRRGTGGGGRLEIGDPVPVATDELRRKMDRLGCVDLLDVDGGGGGLVRRPHSSDSLVPAVHRDASSDRLSVQLEPRAPADAPPPARTTTVEHDWTKYFDACFYDDDDDDDDDVVDDGLRPGVVTTCAGGGGSRQTELDQILDDIVRDIDLLDQTLLNDHCGQSAHTAV